MTVQSGDEMTFDEIEAGYHARNLPVPRKGEVWQHHSGRLYRIDGLRNTAHPSDKFPIMVDYTGTINGEEWSRPLDDWHRSFTLRYVQGALRSLYYPRETTLSLTAKLWPVMIRSVMTDHGDGKKGMSMGGPVAYCDTEEQAKQLADILNSALPPSPDEPE